MRSAWLITGILLCMAFMPSGHDYPKDYFDLPVNRPIKLSGTFGELRSNHFHAGIDIKTLNGRPGEKIYASAPGYVARIKVEPGGYGNALYIAHPNGYTTVYAHLDRFTPEIAAYIKSKQYELQRFSVDLHPRPDQFTINQGQHIAYLGNSGSSFGPHLHFEIRRSAGQVPVNPFLFGLPLQDQVRPEIQRLKVYYLNDKFGRLRTVDYDVLRVGPGEYTLAEPLTEGAWRVGFGLRVIDQMNATPNRNGIYALEMKADGELQYAFEMEDMPFSKTRYLNAHLDYHARANDQGSFHRCYKVPGNALDMYEENGQKGVVQLFAEKARTITLTAKDFNGNISTLSFEIARDTAIWEPPPSTYDYVVSHDKGLAVNTDDLKVWIPATAFYEPAVIDYRMHALQPEGTFAYQHDIGTHEIPLHTYGTISVRCRDLPPHLQGKAFVARSNDGGHLVNCGGQVKGPFVGTRIRSLGTYTVGVDTIPPAIQPLQFTTDMRNTRRMTFRITDNMPTSGVARGLRYRAEVDGQWILMEYDAKSDLLTHHFDDRIPEGQHELVLTVRDDRDNVTTYEANIVR